MTPELWALEGLILVGLTMVAWLLWPDPAPRGRRTPGRQPNHRRWEDQGRTTRLADQWPTAAARARVDPQCACPVLIMGGEVIEPDFHYAGCPKARPGDRRQ